MKYTFLALLFLSLISFSAFAKTRDAKDYPLTAHVTISEIGSRPSAATTVDPQTGAAIGYSTVGRWSRTVELRISGMTYVTSCRGRCDDAPLAGSDQPARIEKHNLHLLIDKKGKPKDLGLEIIGTRE